ncbi:MAG: alcohol dehydrogenase catalytic domain-containing protein [Planctomycetes bacterium]|nr:alcohol dehydrogenase catalytic domain-containing protein [Planctomycetota bacterium]
MRAVVKYAEGAGNMALREVAEPTAGAGEVKIKVEAVGICGSDLHIYNWDIGIPTQVPFIVGHEFAGFVVEVGEGVSGLKEGDRVTAENSRTVCGRCRYCMMGSYNLCRERKATGYAYDGAYAEYCVVPAERVHLLPDNVDFITASLSDPSACVYHAVGELTGVDAGDVVLITGAGAMGLFSVQYVKANGGIAVITGLAQDTKRLALAKELGADVAVDVSKDDVGEIVMELSKGAGADIVLECSGAEKAAQMGLDLLRRQGKYTQIGIFGKPITFDLDKVLYGEVQLIGSFSQKFTAWKEAIKLFGQGKILAKPLVTDLLRLEDWEEGFRKCFAGEAVKVVFEPQV